MTVISENRRPLLPTESQSVSLNLRFECLINLPTAFNFLLEQNKKITEVTLQTFYQLPECELSIYFLPIFGKVSALPYACAVHYACRDFHECTERSFKMQYGKEKDNIKEGIWALGDILLGALIFTAHLAVGLNIFSRQLLITLIDGCINILLAMPQFYSWVEQTG